MYASESSYTCFWYFLTAFHKYEDLWKFYGKTSLSSKYLKLHVPHRLPKSDYLPVCDHGRSWLGVFWAMEI